MKYELSLRNFNTGDGNKWICYKNVSDKNELVEFVTDDNPTEAVRELLLGLGKVNKQE